MSPAEVRLGRRQIYDVPARGYDELYRLEQLEKYEAIFSGLSMSLSEVWVVADVGCATGLLGEYLRSRGFSGVYVGIDLDEERLKVAAERAGPEWMLIQADAENLPLRTRSIDLAASITVIHLLDVEKSLKELFRASRKAVALTLLKKRGDLQHEILRFLTEVKPRFVRRISTPGLKDYVFVAEL